MNSSHTPELPSVRIMWTRPSQRLKSPTTLTPRALGAHTANDTPRMPRHLAHVRAELVVGAIVLLLAPQMKIEIAERRHERVRIVSRERLAVGIVNLELIRKKRDAALDGDLEQSREIAHAHRTRRVARHRSD